MNLFTTIDVVYTRMKRDKRIEIPVYKLIHVRKYTCLKPYVLQIIRVWNHTRYKSYALQIIRVWNHTRYKSYAYEIIRVINHTRMKSYALGCGHMCGLSGIRMACTLHFWLVTFQREWSHVVHCGAVRPANQAKNVAAALLSKTAAAAAAAKTWFAKHPLDYMLHNRFPWKRSGCRSSMWPPYSLRRNLSAAACRPCDRSLRVRSHVRFVRNPHGLLHFWLVAFQQEWSHHGVHCGAVRPANQAKKLPQPRCQKLPQRPLRLKRDSPNTR